MNSTDVLIVGAGVIGLTAAHELLRRGASARLLERNADTVREASWASAGFLRHRVTTRDAYGWLSRTGLERYPSLADELREATGVDVGYRPDGGFEVAFTEEKRQSLLRFQSLQRQRGLEAEWMEPEAVRRLEPNLSAALLGGTFFARDAQVRPPRLLRALRLAVERMGCDLRIGATVHRLREDADGRVVGVASSSGDFAAGAVLLASGCWSRGVAETARVFLPVRPVRGQMLLLDAPAGILTRTVSAEGTYLVQRGDGTFLVGSTLEEVGFDATVTEEGIARLRSGAERAMPALRSCATLRAWAGLRPSPAKRYPYIASPRPGLWVATGHFRTGILMAPSTALLVSTAILDGTTAVPLDDFDPMRDRERVAREEGAG